MNRSILFLDIASNVGFCKGEPGQKPYFGSFRASADGDAADKFAGIFKWVASECQAFKPRHLFFEAPLARNATTAEILMGMAASAQAAARLCGVWSIKRTHVNSVRAFFLPKGSPRSGDAVKFATIAECRRRGLDPKNDDEADAIAGWYTACNQVAKDVDPYLAPAINRQFYDLNGLRFARESHDPKADDDGFWAKSPPKSGASND